MIIERRRELVLVGLSHRTAPVEVRERCAVQPSDVPTRLAALNAIDGVEECCLLSTCNRSEVLLWCRDPGALAETLKERFFPTAQDSELYTYRGVHALVHVFRVAAGLDSLVLGESQILAQIKEALGQAEAAGTLGTHLQPLLRQALTVGKRVRNETSVGRGSLSVARVGVDLAGHVFDDFARLQVLILGAGDTGLLVAKHLKDRGVGQMVFANRTIERAVDAAESLGGLHCGLDELSTQLKRSDLVVACVDAGRHLITPEIVREAKLVGRDRPALMIDLSVPRAIDPAVAQNDNVLYYDLDDLARVVDKNRAERERGDAESAEILVTEVHKFLSLRELAQASPVVSEMKARFDNVREAVLDEVAGPNSNPEQVQLAHELTRRLLDTAFGSFKDSIRQRRSTEELESEYRRYLDNL